MFAFAFVTLASLLMLSVPVPRYPTRMMPLFVHVAFETLTVPFDPVLKPMSLLSFETVALLLMLISPVPEFPTRTLPLFVHVAFETLTVPFDPVL